MKKLTILTFLLSVFFLTPVFSSQENCVLQEKATHNKIYVDIDDVFFGENGIILDGLIEVHQGTRALRFDNGGYYVLSSDECWTCPRCGHSNQGSYNGQKCSKCEWPFWDDKKSK